MLSRYILALSLIAAAACQTPAPVAEPAPDLAAPPRAPAPGPTDALRADRETAKVEDLRHDVRRHLQLSDARPAKVFDALIGARRVEVRRLAWQVATAHPSAAVAEAVENELSKRGADGMSPEAALAAQANDIRASYPLIRQALMGSGHPTFAKAMTVLNPEAAADDLLTYVTTVDEPNRHTAQLALRWFEGHPPSPHHPALSQLEDLRAKY